MSSFYSKKKFGQNFLKDYKVLTNIINSAELISDDHVVEIGPGKGFLTKAILEKVKKVVAIEIDSSLNEILTSKFQNYNNFEIIYDDARNIEIDFFDDYKMLANLPYYAALPIIRRFLLAKNKPSLMVVMLQKEVAQSMVAKPGSHSLLSISTQIYSKPSIISYVSPNSFQPKPKVTSALVKLIPFQNPIIDIYDEKDFFEFLKKSFSSPRKQLKNSIENGLKITSESALEILFKSNILHTRRAQTLTINEWSLLYKQWCVLRKRDIL